MTTDNDALNSAITQEASLLLHLLLNHPQFPLAGSGSQQSLLGTLGHSSPKSSDFCNPDLLSFVVVVVMCVSKTTYF